MNVTPLPVGTMAGFDVAASIFLNGGSITNAGTVAQNPSFAAQSLAGNAQTIAGPAGYVGLASNLTITPSGTVGGAGTLSVVPGGGGVGTVGTVVAGAGMFVNAGTPGGTVTTNGALNVGEFVNTQSVTTYTIQPSDQAKLVNCTYATGIQPAFFASGSLYAGFVVDLVNSSANIGYAHASSGSINNQASLYLAPYSGVHIVFDGTNYEALVGSQFVLDANATLHWTNALSLGTSNTFGINYISIAVGQSITVGNFAAGFGQGHTVGSYGGAFGVDNVVGYQGLGHGVAGSDQGVTSSYFHAAQESAYSVTAQYQRNEMVIVGGGTSALRVTTDGHVASATNVPQIANNTRAVFRIYAQVFDDTAGGFTTFTGLYSDGKNGVIINRGSSAATTTMGTVTWTQGATVGTIGAVGAMSAAADTTYGGFNIAYTPGAGNTNTMHIGVRLDVDWIN